MFLPRFLLVIDLGLSISEDPRRKAELCFRPVIVVLNREKDGVCQDRSVAREPDRHLKEGEEDIGVQASGGEDCFIGYMPEGGDPAEERPREVGES